MKINQIGQDECLFIKKKYKEMKRKFNGISSHFEN